MSRETEIQLFDAFALALKKLCSDDYLLFSSQRKKGPITHRIAMYLEMELNSSNMICDTQFVLKGENRSYLPDIIVHDRKGNEKMALFWQDGYLSAHDREEARDFHREKQCFTLAFSLLPEKGYFLIYRFAENYTDYLHISREDFSEQVLRRCNVDEDIFSDQLMLNLPKKKRKAKMKEESVKGEDTALTE